MKHAMLLATAVVTSMAASAPAEAQDRTPTVSAGVTGGTLGVGPQVGYRFSENAGVRANATFLGLGRDVDSDGVNYDGDLKLRSFGGALDLYPMGGGFRISPGFRISDNHVRLEARPTEDVEIGDNLYTPEEIGEISGRVKAKKFAPILTVGWGGGMARGLKFGIDAGVMLQGSPRVTDLETSGMLNDPELQADIERERAEIEDDIDKFKYYPVLQLSLGYAF